ncbi:MAG: ATP-binding protein [Defluviitaleaceae bacterium]|nr:ATP-binding protein [Defluviitaleaceae bacterium]MCL2836695.1 ATP-binding protein [Defluviitaleaceae bacterium]
MRKISTKLFLVSLVSIILAGTVVLVPALFSMTQIIDELARVDMQSSMNTIEAVVDSRRESTLGASVKVAQTRDIITALQAGDNLMVSNLINALYDDVLIFLDPSFVTITDSQGIVVARMHSSETGDDISSRRGVSRALNNLHTSDIEPDGESALGIVSTVPIVAGEAVIGTVAVGYDMGQPAFVDYLQHITNTEVTVFAYNISIMTTIVSQVTGERSFGIPIAPHIAEVVLGRKEIFHMETEIAPRPGELFLAYYKPFLDETGEVLGLIFTGQNLTSVRNIERQAIRTSLILSALVILLVFLGSRYVYNKIIVIPVKHSIQAVTQLSEGNLKEVNFTGHSRDELGELSSSTHKLASAILRQQQLMERERELELKLREQEMDERVRLMFDAAPILIEYWDKNYDAIDCNQTTLDYYGFTGKEEYRADNRFDFSDFHQDGVYIGELWNSRLERIFKDGYDKFEFKVKNSNGDIAFHEVEGIRLKYGDDTVAITYSKDATQLADAKKQLEAALEQALLASQTKSTFLANMSHEIRTPMNAILGITDILMHSEAIPAEVEEGLEKIYNSCDMLLGIINDILDFSKIEAGKLDIMPAPYNVASLINDSAQLNMMRIGEKPIRFELQVDENLPVKLIGDELRIKQILNNLLSNAFKYTDTGKVTLGIKPEAREQKPETGNNEVILVLSVRDTGCGMTENQLSRLFIEYSRFNEGAYHAVEGTGLGLAITRRLTDLMNGEINVESEQGRGSLFTVRLPQEKTADSVLGSEIAQKLQEFRINHIHSKHGRIMRESMPYGSVLIVDDVETNLYVAEGLMKPYKLRIETAISGRDAIDKIRDGSGYDVIFMDHMMPEMDGIETAKHLRDSGYSGSIVALTANAVVGQSEMFLMNGFNDFISKPIDIRQLDSLLNKLIRDKQPPEVIEAARQQLKNSNGGAAINGNDKHQITPLLIESFIRDSRKTLATLDEICKKTGWVNSEEDLRMYTIFIHGIKSSLWNIGETTLSETAESLEKAGRSKNTDMLTASTHEFLSKLRMLLEKTDAKRENNANGADENIEELREKLLSIGEMCAEYDRKGVLDNILKIGKCSAKTRAVLDSIKGYILYSEFEEAEKTAIDAANAL